VIEQVIEPVREGAGQELFAKNYGKKLRRPVNYLVAGHRDGIAVDVSRDLDGPAAVSLLNPTRYA
jgi:hypothetical protein